MPAPGKNIVAGNLEPVAQGLSIERSLTEGQRVVKSYKAEADNALRAFDIMSVGATRSRYKQDGSIATIELEYSVVPGESGNSGASLDTYLVEEVTYQNNQIQISIWDTAYFSILTSNDIALILTAIQSIKDVKVEPLDDPSQVEVSGNPGQVAADKIQGIKDSVLSQYTGTTLAVVTNAMAYLLSEAPPAVAFFPTVSYRRVVAAASAFRLDASITGTMYSTGNLPVPAAKADNTPLLGWIQTPDVATTLALRPGFGFGWLGQTQMNTLSDGSVEFTSTFTYGSYPYYYYFGTWDQTNI